VVVAVVLAVVVDDELKPVEVRVVSLILETIVEVFPAGLAVVV